MPFSFQRKSPKPVRKLDPSERPPRSPKHEPRSRMQQQQQLLQQQHKSGGKKGWSSRANVAGGRDAVDAATSRGQAQQQMQTTQGTSTGPDDAQEDASATGSSGSIRAKGPNPRLRKGPNDDLLL